MTRRSWSEEDKADVRQHAICGFTYAEIAKRYGVSAMAIANLVKRNKLLTVAETSAVKSFRLKGGTISKDQRQKLRRAAKKNWRDPAFREAAIERHRALHKTEVGRAIIAKASRHAVRARRGFDLPATMADDYRHLTQSKKISAAEAGRILGIPAIQFASKGA